MNERSQRSWRAASGLYVARQLGLTDNLKFCLDAGDLDSYTSGQLWNDLSGNGTDFFLGADVTVTASDPTFTGTAGQVSSGEYFALNGAQAFRHEAANLAWMENIHKDNAKFTFLTWVYAGATNPQSMLCGTTPNTTQTGFSWRIRSDALQQLVVGFGTGTTLSQAGSAATAVPTAAWSLVGVSLDEAVGANGLVLFLNGATDLRTSTYTTPATGAAQFTLELAAGGAINSPLLNGSRMAMFSAWDVPLTIGQMNAYFNATRGRFGV